MFEIINITEEFNKNILEIKHSTLEHIQGYEEGASLGKYWAKRDSFKIIENNNKSINSNSKGELDKMPYIHLRKDQRYEARISFKGKKYSIYDKDKNKLQLKIVKKFKELKKNYKNTIESPLTKKDNITLKEYYLTWLELDKKPFISENTLFSINNCFNNHIIPKIGNVKLKDINKNIIQTFLNNMPKNRVKEISTTYLKSCITQAYKEDYILKNPFDLVKIDKKIKSNKIGFTAEEQKLILDYLKWNQPNWYSIILCYLCLGCRRSEIFTIKIENIKNGLVLINGTKTHNAKRYVKITPQFEVILKNTIYTLQIVNPHWFTRKFKEILTELKLQGSLHSLRHCFITNHYYLGTPAKQVQEWVEHSTINLTLDIYTNINPQIETVQEKERIKLLYNNLYYYTD